MSRVLSRRARSFIVVGAVLGGLAGCAGEIDPSLIPGAGGSGSPVGQAGTGGTGGGGGGAAVCNAPEMVFVASCALPGCHSANTIGGAGLDLASAGVAGRLLGQGPSTNSAAGAACSSVGKPYLLANSNPATGLLMDKMDALKVTCGSTMSVLGGLTPAQLSCLSAWATALTTGSITP